MGTIIVSAAALAIVAWILCKGFVFKKSQSEYNCFLYVPQQTPFFRYFGKPFKPLAFEMDKIHVYVSVRIKKGIVAHFITCIDSEDDYSICAIERWGNMFYLKMNLFEEHKIFRSSKNVVENFELSSIVNNDEVELTDENFEVLKKALIVAAQRVETEQEKF